MTWEFRVEQFTLAEIRAAADDHLQEATTMQTTEKGIKHLEAMAAANGRVRSTLVEIGRQVELGNMPLADQAEQDVDAFCWNVNGQKYTRGDVRAVARDLYRAEVR